MSARTFPLPNVFVAAALVAPLLLAGCADSQDPGLWLVDANGVEHRCELDGIKCGIRCDGNIGIYHYRAPETE